MKGQLIDTGTASAADNMAFDQKLLHSYSENRDQPPVLHLYEWALPSITYGYFINPFTFLNEQGVKEARLDLARRPTGGGITLHMADFAFSLLVPSSHPGYSLNTLENYAFINQLVKQLVSKFIGAKKSCSLLESVPPPTGPCSQHFCMAQPTKFDLLFNGRKVGGAAQRRTKDAFLHQGTLSLTFPEESLLKKILLSSSEVIPAMRQNTHTLLGSSASQKEIEEARALLKKEFCSMFSASTLQNFKDDPLFKPEYGMGRVCRID